MRLSFPLTSLIVTLIWAIAHMQDISCGEDELCVYQCHCNSCYRPDGRCPDNTKCNTGWFGARCQYRDLLTIPRAKTESRPWMTDRDDSTCNNNTDFQEVSISWPETYPVMGLRMVLNDTSMFSSIKIVYNKSGEFKECENQKWLQLEENTMDIRCEENVITTTLKIQGNIMSLCSLYVNGGRNVAYKQSTTQSSTYGLYSRYSSDLAVDGNTHSEFNYGTCSHTADYDLRPQFTLTFNTSYIIRQYILYNRAGPTALRLQGFLFVLLDEKNKSVQNITDPYMEVQTIYFINGYTSESIKSLSINATRKVFNDPSPILTLCEVEAYGECPLGKWSLPCTRNCPSSCPTSCDKDTGLCNTICFGFSNPPACTEFCKTGTWGINCNNTCSTKCAYLSCHPKTGECTQGCLGYSNPPQCTAECLNSTWGVNCNRNCCSHCVNNTCTARDGACYGGCEAGYQLPDCTIACEVGLWGVNCTNKCSIKCLDLSCDSTTGLCLLASAGCNGSSNCEKLNNNIDSLPKKIIIAIAVSVTLVALLTIVACLIVLKVKGKLCFDGKEIGRQLTDLPVILADESTLDNEKKVENKEYYDISNAYDMPATHSQDEHTYRLPSNTKEKGYSNLEIQVHDDHTYELPLPEKASNY